MFSDFRRKIFSNKIINSQFGGYDLSALNTDLKIDFLVD